MHQPMFTVCSCGYHATITNAVDETGFQVWSQQYAEYMISQGIKFGVISAEDAILLREMVAGSKLPKTDTDVTADVKAIIAAYNQFVSQGVDVGMDSVHSAINLAMAKLN